MVKVVFFWFNSHLPTKKQQKCLKCQQLCLSQVPFIPLLLAKNVSDQSWLLRDTWRASGLQSAAQSNLIGWRHAPWVDSIQSTVGHLVGTVSFWKQGQQEKTWTFWAINKPSLLKTKAQRFATEIVHEGFDFLCESIWFQLWIGIIYIYILYYHISFSSLKQMSRGRNIFLYDIWSMFSNLYVIYSFNYNFKIR